MRGFVMAMVVVVAGATMAAQTVESVIDLTSFGWGPLTVPQSIETDGDFATREWLVRRAFSPEMRVVAERGGTACAGPWFTPTTNGTTSVQRVGVIHKLITQLPDGRVEVTALLTPSCP